MSFLRFFVGFLVNLVRYLCDFLVNFGNNFQIQSTNFTNPIFSFPKSFDQILRIILRINLKQIFLVVFLFSLIFNSIFSNFSVLAQNNNSNNSDLQEIYPLYNQKLSNRINLMSNNISNCFFVPEMVNNFKQNTTYCNIQFETKTVGFLNFGSVEALAGEKIVEGADILGIKNKLSNSTSDKIASKIDGIGDTDPTCGENTISIEKIIAPGAFFPVIPCAVTKDGKVQPLSPALIPDILVRAFGLIASLTFYLFSGILILSGVMFIWDGIDGQSRKRAERNIIDTLWALLLIFGAYTILITILTLLNFNFGKTKTKFFDFGGN